MPHLLPKAWLMAAVVATTACAAIYPEYTTPLSPVPKGAEAAPPPPGDLLWLEVASAVIPERTRDGRSWGKGDAPDPFAKLVVDGRTVYQTPVQESTLKPRWSDQKGGNFRIPKGSKVRVELWDSHALTDKPICVKKIPNIHDEAGSAPLTVACDSGARIELVVEPARPQVGLGFSYELRTASLGVTAVHEHSPAGRVGMKAGDVIRRIDGKPVRGEDEAGIRGAINSGAKKGLSLTVEHRGGKVEDVTLREGAVYVVAPSEQD